MTFAEPKGDEPKGSQWIYPNQKRDFGDENIENEESYTFSFDGENVNELDYVHDNFPWNEPGHGVASGSEHDISGHSGNIEFDIDVNPGEKSKNLKFTTTIREPWNRFQAIWPPQRWSTSMCVRIIVSPDRKIDPSKDAIIGIKRTGISYESYTMESDLKANGLNSSSPKLFLWGQPPKQP